MQVFFEILQLLWEVIRFVIRTVTNVVAAVLLALPILLPWRWSYLASTWHRACVEGERYCWRLFCLEHFCLALIDVVTVPLGVVSCLVPTRGWAQIVYLRDQPSSASPANLELRMFWGFNFFMALVDVVVFAVSLPSLLVPSRWCHFFRSISKWFVELHGPWFEAPEHDFEGVLLQPELLGGLVCALLELLSGLAAALLAVTAVRSCTTWREVSEAWPEREEDPGWKKYGCYWKVHAIILRNGILLLVDIFFVPLIILLLLGFWRFPPVCRELRRAVDMRTRCIILRETARLVIDLLLAPLTVVILLTWYRSEELRAASCHYKSEIGSDCDSSSESSSSDSEGDGTSSSGSSSDSESSGARRARRRQRRRERREQAHFILCTPCHPRALSAASLLLADLLCLPFLLLLLVTWYRRPDLANFRKRGFRFHREVLCECMNILVDLPFFACGLVVIATCFRADAAWRVLTDRDEAPASTAARSESETTDEDMLEMVPAGRKATTACDRRCRILCAFFEVLRDVLCLLPAALLVGTLVRLPTFLARLGGKCRPPLIEEPLLRISAARLLLVEPRGNPKLRLTVSGPPDLEAVRSMQVTLVGEGFWKAVANELGDFLGSVAQAYLPYRLLDGRHADFAALEGARGGTAELEITLDREVRKEGVTDFFDEDFPQNVRVLLHIEGYLESGRRAVLVSLPLTGAELTAACADDDGEMTAASMERGDWQLPGEPFVGEPFRDAWWSVVLGEFAELLNDVVHLALAAVLVVLFWRFFDACRDFRKSRDMLAADAASRVVDVLKVFDRQCVLLSQRLEPLLGSYAKELMAQHYREGAVEGDRGGRSRPNKHRRRDFLEWSCCECFLHCCCCCCRPHEGDQGGENKFYTPLDGAAVLSLLVPVIPWAEYLTWARSHWPEGASWAPPLAPLQRALAQRQEAFYWQFIMPAVHGHFSEGKIDEITYGELIERVRARTAACQQRQRESLEAFEQLVTQRRASLEDERSCEVKSKSAVYEIIRYHVGKGIVEVLTLPLTLLLVVTFYRLPSLWEKVRGVGDREVFKRAVHSEVHELFRDVGVLLQLLFLTLILTVTLARLPRFLSELQPAKGLRWNHKLAWEHAKELGDMLRELLELLCLYRTYELLVSGAIFVVLAPAAMLSVAFPCPSTALRFACGSITWLAMIAGCMWLSGPMVIVGQGAVFALAFAGLCCAGVQGWLRPREDAEDWWSPEVRPSFPNALALLTVLVEALTLASLAWPLAPGAERGSFEVPLGGEVAQELAIRFAALALLLTTLPMVAYEEDRSKLLQHGVWRSAMALLQDILFLPVVVVLLPLAVESWKYRIFLLYFVGTALLAAPAYNATQTYGMELDIRTTDLAGALRRLLLLAAAWAAVAHERNAFLGIVAASVAWTLVTACGSCSVLWAQVLRLGVGLGALAVALLDWRAGLAAWLAAALAAAAARSCLARRRYEALARTLLPSTLQQLRMAQARLSLWRTIDGSSAEGPGGAAAAELPEGLSSVGALARYALELEAAVPAERLTVRFLRDREGWCEDVHLAVDHESLLELVEQLLQGISVPTTQAMLLHLLAAIPIPSARRCLYGPLASAVAGFLGDGRAPAAASAALIGEVLRERKEHHPSAGSVIDFPSLHEEAETRVRRGVRRSDRSERGD